MDALRSGCLLVPDSDFRSLRVSNNARFIEFCGKVFPLSHDSSNETLNGRIASVNLILNDTPAQRRGSPDRGNESNLLNIASDDDKRHGYGIPRFPPYSRKCLNFVLNIINYETYDNNSLGDSFVKSYL